MRRHPPGPKSVRPLGPLREFGRDPLAYLMKLATYGDVARVRVGLKSIFHIARPDLIEDVLVRNHRKFVKSRGLRLASRILGDGLLTTEGEVHRRQRAEVAPSLLRGAVERYAEAMVARSKSRASSWRDGQVVDIASEMQAMTMEIVGETLFGADLSEKTTQFAEAIDRALGTQVQAASSPWTPLRDRLPLASTRRFRAAKRVLDDFMDALIDERLSHRSEGDDVLSRLCRSSDVDALRRREIRDQGMTLFMAGHETLAAALTWSLSLLARNPDAQAAIHEELERVLGDREVCYEDVEGLEETRRALTEAMRLYPPVYMLGRQAIDDHTLDGFDVPKGSVVLMSQFVVHRREETFPEAECFLPSRWKEGRVTKQAQQAYFPFGLGPRACLGERFAWTEGVLGLASLLRRWSFSTEEPEAPAIQLSFTLRAAGRIPLTLKARPHAVGKPSQTVPHTQSG